MTAAAAPATADAAWSLHGLQALILRNEQLSVVALPELGGKVWEIHDRLSGRQLLWHHPRLRPGRLPFGSGYDDAFYGGWDELFPNDVPEVLSGEAYPDHGELWSLPWDWTTGRGEDGSASLTMSVGTPISSCTVTKTITLDAGARGIRVDHILTADGPPLPFLWKQHLALAGSVGARIDLGARDMLIGDFGTPRAGGPGTGYVWPYLDDATGRHDMRETLSPASRTAELQYATALQDGWCALTHRDGTGIGLRFDRELFRSCWTFASYGGWRNLDVVVLEPCTGYPLSVTEGVADGTHQVLAAGETLRTSMTLDVFDGTRSGHDHD